MRKGEGRRAGRKKRVEGEGIKGLGGRVSAP